MDELYWYAEYIKVFMGYIILLYIWPSIVFRKYLKEKGMIFRFMFCSSVQIPLINMTVLGLGLLHILNGWVVRGLFYGILVVSLVLCGIRENKKGYIIKYFLSANCGWKVFMFRILEAPTAKIKNFWIKYKKCMTEGILLAFILIFGMIYFSYGAFQDHSYGCSDQYTHHGWIYELQQGKIFAEGIYPEAMHCFIYSMRTLFGIRVYSCILFLGGIHVCTFLLAAYCFLRKIFNWRYTPLYALIAYLVFNIMGEGALDAMARFQWAIPQEFGLYLAFLCPAYLFSFFQKDNREMTSKEWFKNENLLLLMLGVGAAIATHFYVILMAFFLSLAVVITYLKRLLSKDKILSLLYAVLYGVEMGGVPMALAYIMGKNLQDSLRWGISTMQGESAESVGNQLKGSISRTEWGDFLKDIYEKGYLSLFGEKVTLAIIIIFLLLIVFFFLYKIFFYRKKSQKDKFEGKEELFKGYFSLALSLAFFVFLYAAPYMGLPEVIAVIRIFSIIHMLVCGTFLMLVDLVLFLAVPNPDGRRIWLEMSLACVIVYCFGYVTNFHEFLYCGLGRYNAATSVLNEIIRSFPRYSYTIISTDSELYQVSEEGRHEEILDFAIQIDKKEYFLPTEYVFLYVEKHPILYEQRHFFTGPSWLARKNQSVYVGGKSQSQCPEILHSELSLKAAEKNISFMAEPQDNYKNLDIRTFLFSKAYMWYQEFSKYYPAETDIYYEDDDFVCYFIHQNPNSLLNIALYED